MILLQAVNTPGADLLLERGEKIGVVALLVILVYILHRQNERREAALMAQYEKRIEDFKAIVDQLRREIDHLNKP